MLQNIRNNTKGVIAKIIIGLIIIPFALFGIDSLFGGRSAPYIAKVNGVEISEWELERAIILQTNRLLADMGEAADPALLDDTVIRTMALDSLIQDEVWLQAAQRDKLIVPDALLDQTIVSIPSFQEAGEFSSELYLDALRRNGYTPAYFKQLMANDLLIAQLRNGIAFSQFVTESELAMLAALIDEQRNFHYQMIPRQSIADITLSPEAVEAYYNAHRENFKTEERLVLDYIELKVEDFYQPVAEQTLRDAHSKEMLSFNDNEERRVSHILLAPDQERSEQATEALASTLIEQLQAGVDFATLVERYSADVGSIPFAGDLGYTHGDTFPPAFEQAIFALDAGEMAEPVWTDAGLHIIKVTDRRANERPSFEQRRPFLEQQLQAAEAADHFFNTVEALQDLSFNADNLIDPADALDLSVTRTDWLARTSTQGIFAYPQVRQAVASDDVLLERYNSEVVELAPDHFIVLHVVDYQLPDVQPLSAVQALIEVQLLDEQAREQTQQRATDRLAQLQSGVQQATDWHRARDVQRNTAVLVDSAANTALLRAVFAMPADGLDRYAMIPLPAGDIALVQLDTIQAGDLTAMNKLERNALQQATFNNAVNQSVTRYQQALHREADIQRM